MEFQQLNIDHRCRHIRWITAWLLALSLLALCPALFQAKAEASPANEGEPLGPVLLREDATGLLLEWQAPPLSIRETMGADGRPYAAVEAAGWRHTDKPGRPQLPYALALAVVPPDGEVELRVEVLEREHIALPAPVLPAARWVAAGDPPKAGYEWAREERAYAPAFAAFRRANEPDPVVILEEAGWQRGRRLVQLIFYPLHFDPASPALEVIRRVRVELSFDGEAWTGEVAADPFTSVLQGTVVNPAQVDRFVRYSGPSVAADLTARSLDAAALLASSAPTSTQYLIITHADFASAVAPLVNHRAISDGLTVYVTTTQSIYSALGYSGAPAFRDYISATYHSTTPPNLTYVLLVGDGTEDGSGTQYVPPYLIDDPWGQEDDGVASDNRFATMDGDDDQEADLYIGRLPVQSAAQATTVVNKILAYELDPPQWPWNQYALFLADNPEVDAPFHLYSDSVHSTLPVTFTGWRVYYCKSGCNQPHLYDDIDMAHVAAMGSLNSGPLLVSYEGHSSWHQWAQERLFHLDDVSSLGNEALPVFLEMTCYTSRFAYPSADTLDESLLRRAGGGAVATWGCTALGDSSNHQRLHYRFFEAVFQDGQIELGAAIAYAKLGLPETTTGNGLRDTFILLGDPAMELNLTIVPWPNHLFLPLALRSQ